jgi:hypothetical protein
MEWDDSQASGGDAGAEGTLRRLEERLSRASDAAERLIAEAAQAARERPPGSGWQARADAADDGSSELDRLIEVARAVRDLVPPELQRRLAEALRELLLAVRALIDWYLERAERRRATPVEVQDIPIL